MNVTISDTIDNSATITHGSSTASAFVPTQTFTSKILPCHKDVVMDRVYEAGRRLRAKEIRLDEYFGLLNVAKVSWWVTVLN